MSVTVAGSHFRCDPCRVDWPREELEALHGHHSTVTCPICFGLIWSGRGEGYEMRTAESLTPEERARFAAREAWIKQLARRIPVGTLEQSLR
jgi:hypothetical protein